MTQRIFTDRSRILQGQRCPRSRWWAYHAEGQGLAPGKTPLPLGVGSAVHSGLAVLLAEAQKRVNEAGGLDNMAQWLPFIEDLAVEAALAEFVTTQEIELDTAEQAAMAVLHPTLEDQLKASLTIIKNREQ